MFFVLLEITLIMILPQTPPNDIRNSSLQSLMKTLKKSGEETKIPALLWFWINLDTQLI